MADNELKQALDELAEREVPSPTTDYESRLRARLHATSPRRSRRGWIVGAIAAALAAAAIVWASLAGVPGVQQTEPQTATAAVVAAKMVDALSQTRSLHGTMHYHIVGPGLNGRRAIWDFSGSFILTADGSERSDMAVHTSGAVGANLPSRIVGVFDAQRHVTKAIDYLTFDRVVCHEFPDQVLSMSGIMGQTPPTASEFEDSAALVAVALAEGDPSLRIEETTFQGRPAWKTTLRPSSEFKDTTDVIVDRQTGCLLLMRATTFMNGTVSRRDVTFSNLVVNGQVPAGSFDVSFPQPKPGVGSDHRGSVVIDKVTPFGAHIVSLDRVYSRVGYRPLVPAVLSGFGLSTVATSAGPGVREPGAPDKDVWLVYRRGLEWVVVEMYPWPKGTPPGAYADTLGYERTVLTGGALKGKEAITTFAQGPELIAHGAGLNISIAGDVSRTDLLALANSLQPLK